MIRTIIIFILLIFTIYQTVRTNNIPDTLDCGIVIEKTYKMRGSRRHVSSHNILVVQFNNGEIMEIEPTISDYYLKKVEDKICYKNYFNEEKESSEGFAILGWFLLIVLLLSFIFK